MPNVAVIGIGSWGRNLLRTFDGLADVSYCCHTGRPAHADWLTEHFPNVSLTTDLETVLADEAVDAVVIATPIPTLAGIAEQAIRAGKDVFVEKPMAQSPAAARDLARLATQEDVLLFVGYIFVHHPFFRQAGGFAQDNNVRAVQFDWGTVGSYGPDLVANLVCHPVAVSIDWFGPPGEIVIRDAQGITNGIDVVDLTLAYEDFTCSLRVDRLAPDKHYVARVYGSENACCVATDDSFNRFQSAVAEFATTTEMDADPLCTECKHFLEARAGNCPPITDGMFGVRVADVLDRIADRIEHSLH